ncbi:LbtU family siderophore porin [Deferrisoma camini]|uniref:LbtU family siderophore porin n=1 Tax=Deferrisoma camini TaxID=1035120 RepID=UPI0004AFFAE3|nr:LbtU family siderophore porin [Deferrisoma camini]
MRRVVIALPLVLVPGLASAATTLEERVEALEKKNAELYHTLQQKKQAGLMTKISEKISFSGLLELEAAYESTDPADGDREATSDLTVATAQLGFDAQVNDQLTAALVLLFEEDETEPIEVDEATVDYARDGWTARFGRQYLPFGAYPSHMISDPLTLELGEIRETAVQVGYEGEGWTASAFVFNGDAEKVNGAGEAEEDHVKDWGVSVVVTPVEGVEAGASFLSDLADTDAELVGEYRDRVGGWSAYAVVGFGAFEVLGEVMGSVGAFDEADLDEDEDGRGDRPLAWNVEGAWDVSEVVEVAVRVEGSRELGGQPELQYGAVVSWGPMEGVSLSLEYLHGEYDEDFGGGVDSRDLATAQLAVEF